MSEQVLTILTFVLLALLYLFFFRVLRAVWAEIGSPRATRRVAAAGAPVDVAPAPVAAAPPKARKPKKGMPSELVVVEPADRRGTTFTVGDELTVGRAAGCQITIDDTYVSSLHARVFRRDGQVLVEDLGSTNGTYLNRAKVGGAIGLAKGDRLQFGNTILEAR